MSAVLSISSNMSSIQAVAESYKVFNPRAYLQNNYVPPRADFSSEDSVMCWKLRRLHEACSKGEIKGHTLVDIGSGPTIYQFLSAFEPFQEVILTDYLEVNRQELKMWLNNEHGVFDWSPYFEYVCKLEGKGESWKEKQKRLRERVSRVIPVDIHQSSPLGKEVVSGSIDCLVSSFCLEACSPSLVAFHKALENVVGLLKPQGHFLWIGALEESYYLAGEARLSVLPVTEDMVKKALSKAKCVVREFSTYSMTPSMKVGVDDVSGIFFVWAQKDTPK
ncbi:phenylethanolamine N-methyltransferase [Bufo gargarizans]|uniref:phenylethanolamine N-methyltransferase n=1 Tax=Bufo gargarizans TaxID=30331 RepID=UPI001CF5C94B|nr:phenylethanolamine N-methyltransferase [Bufo gargarizans]